MNGDSVFGTQEYDILKKALYLSVSVFSTKVPIGVPIFKGSAFISQYF